MKVLITAGGTRIPIDEVRAIDNIFHGATGSSLAVYFKSVGAQVTLLTSAKGVIAGFENGNRLSFVTFDELFAMMKNEIQTGNYDAIIHSAAPSDYGVDEVSGSMDGGVTWKVLDRSGKISSTYEKLRVDMSPTIKIVDQIRPSFNFYRKLVKFKLEANMSDEALIEVATKSMHHSKADFIVANCREWYKERAFVIDAFGRVENVTRLDLPAALHRRLI